MSTSTTSTALSSDDFWHDMAYVLFRPSRWADAVAEADGILKLAEPAAGAQVLDLCCGPGRMSLELARRGLAVTGVDRTREYLDEAKRRAAEEGLEVEWMQGDMRTFVRAEAFDLAVSVFTSFGYFLDAAEDRRVVQNLHDSLRPGGQLVMEMGSKEVIARTFCRRDWGEVDGILHLEEREVVGAWEGIQSRWIRVGPTGERVEHPVFCRLYSGVEITHLLRDVGFADVQVFGSLEGIPYDEKAKRLVAVARR